MATIDTTVEYRDIQGFPGYRVGNDGSVWFAWRTCRSGRRITGKWKLMKQGFHKERSAGRRYRHVNLTPPEGGKYQTFKVHRLVLTAFVGPCPEGMECRHLDGDAANNRLSNLCWGTREENIADSKRNGVYTNKPRNRMYSHDGKTLSLKEWASELKLPYMALYQRLRTLGMSFEEAISRPFLGLAGNGRKAR